MNFSHRITQKILSASAAVVLCLALAFISFALFEPLALTAQQTITITQDITAETAFSVNPNSVAMDTNIASITGGASNGTSTFTVQSNNSSGYNVTLSFDQDPAMQQNTGGSNIPDYIEDVAGTPDYGFGNEAGGGSAQFGFSIYGASASVVATNFQDNNTNACGGGGTNQYAQCWSAASTSAVTILDRSDATSGLGDENNVLFRVHVPANPSPAVPADTYTATATLTVAANP